MADYQDILAEFQSYMSNGADHWFQRRHAKELQGPIGYFCAEYGLHESLGIYSGGLGVLAGDHMKTASDMALPLIGVGLMYRKGYFRQTIDADGHQEHAYPDYELARLPIQRALDPLGEPLTVSVPLPGRDLFAAVWVVQVGRVPVLLLDTDVPDNDDSDRPITHILYVRGREMRLHQELVLGVGGVRALRALGLDPAVWHLNEGHSAFLLAERARELVAEGRSLDDAFAAVRRNSVFTIHTPVAAGNERFDADLVRRVAGPLLDGDGRPSTGGVPVERLLGLGLGVENDPSQFDMTALCLRMTHGANAVSQLHGHTANATWQGVSPHEILGLTNGVHTPTWLGQPIRDTLERFTNADLDAMDDQPAARRFWERIGKVPADELWEAHQRQKLELAIFARGRLRNQFARHGEAPATLEELDERPGPQDPDDRVRPPVRDLQAIGAAVHGPRPDGPPAVGRGAPHAGHLRRQGPPRRPARPGRDPGHLRALAQPQAPRPRVHPRGLRHPHRPVPRPGRRRLAEQPAPAARGVRDVGHEGRRRTASSTSASSTAGGTRAGPATTAGRSAAARPTPTRAPRTGPTPRTCTGSSRTS